MRGSTDGHSDALGGDLANAPGAWRRSGPTGDPDIDVLLMRDRRPAGVGAP